ncbi:hypothetical protein RG836_15480 [Pseudomonas sp. SZMC_28357]|uniref:hypothetical protein n=1 Tax=Pseudomonas sp. SZMC_28357 TaxID=3074380 RepID=UPI002872309E|nr:hypothetical protein [Pseudomonas sp. SZMC_28357]MDR9752856.1 hypothetical protein [Pseudomonas sp. SZMC_28357]
MRWLFLLLIVLNGFYYIWHQQEAPLRAKDVTPLNLYRGSQQDIRLLSETADKGRRAEEEAGCLFLGGFARQETLRAVEQRLRGLNIRVQHLTASLPDSEGYWLRVSAEGRPAVDELLLLNLAKEFNELKHKIMPCEGVATAE